MTIYSWCKEFYPVSAKNVPLSEATAHSLQKWKGTKPEALTKHKVGFLKRRSIFDPNATYEFKFDSNSCALCHHHIDKGCETCPILLYKRSLNPDFTFEYEACTAEYIAAGGNFDRPGNTQPMIDLLEETLRFEQEQKASDTGG